MNYCLELPTLQYNKKDLLEFALNCDWQKNPHFEKLGFDTRSIGFYDYYPTDNDLCNLFTEIIDQFKIPLSMGQFKFNKLEAGGYMPWHKDPIRGSVLMFPLTENPSSVHWYERKTKTILHSHTYKAPTIIDGSITHGVPSVDITRIFLQVFITIPFEEIDINNILV